MLCIYLAMLEEPGDKEAFEALYLRYRSKLYHVANDILHDSQLAEDAVADAFFSIARFFHKITSVPQESRIAYCIIVTRHCAIDISRRITKRNEITGCPELIEQVSVVQPEIEGIDIAFRTQKALSQLSEEYRELLLLRYHYGFHYNEIAQMLHISHEAVHTRLSTAKKKLRPILKQMREAEQDPAPVH